MAANTDQEIAPLNENKDQPVFEKGVLQIPYFYVNDRSEIWIRNLIAFEQCQYSRKAYFCSYIQLLDYLVDTDKDVDLLINEGIFVNDMGSSAAVANMINNLMTGVVAFSSCYHKIQKDLNEYYDNSWNRTKATLKHVYFNNLWRGTTTVAAFIVRGGTNSHTNRIGHLGSSNAHKINTLTWL